MQIVTQIYCWSLVLINNSEEIHFVREQLFSKSSLSSFRYWFTGFLKHRFTYIMSTFHKPWPQNKRAELSLSYGCSGCARCYVAPVAQQKRWSSSFAKPPQQSMIFWNVIIIYFLLRNIFYHFFREEYYLMYFTEGVFLRDTRDPPGHSSYSI